VSLSSKVPTPAEQEESALRDIVKTAAAHLESGQLLQDLVQVALELGVSKARIRAALGEKYASLV
jgi:hypothetical protein